MKTIYYVFLAAACVACNQKQNQLSGLYDQKAVKTSERDYNLNAKYNKDSLQAFVDITDNAKKDDAKVLYNKAIDQYRNLKNPDSARYYFDRSLSEYPTGDAYYEEGNLLVDSKLYDEAIKSFNMAEYMNYQPVSKVFYNLACAYSLSNTNGSENAIKFLEYAIEAGYNDVAQIQKDPDLDNIRDDWKYTELINGLKKDAGNPQKTQWNSFRSQFPVVALPAKLNVLNDSLFMDTDDDASSKYISYDFEDYVTEMRTADRYSREVNKDFYYYTQLNITKNYSALVYLVNDYVNYDMPALKYAMLVTYTSSGKIIDKKMIAGFNKIKDPVKVCQLNNDNTFTVINYDKTIRKDKKEEEEVTKVVLSNELSRESWKIGDNGKIMPVSQASLYLPFKFSLDKTIFG